MSKLLCPLRKMPKVELLLLLAERNQLSQFGHLVRPLAILLGEDQGQTQNMLEGLSHLAQIMSWDPKLIKWLARGMSGLPYLSRAIPFQTQMSSGKWMHGWTV